MKRKFAGMIMSALVTGVLLTGCGVKNEEPLQETVSEQEEAYTFTDDLGREVAVENPQRVAALLGSYADIWYLAGGEVIASADDAWDDFNLPMAETAVNLGMTKELSLEKLFEADPDLVLASSNTQGNVEWLETLEAAGITVAYFEVNDFEDYLGFLKICTEITGRDDLYEKNGLAIKDQIAASEMHSNGIEFSISENEVWFCEQVPTTYIAEILYEVE